MGTTCKTKSFGFHFVIVALLDSENIIINVAALYAQHLTWLLDACSMSNNINICINQVLEN